MLLLCFTWLLIFAVLGGAGVLAIRLSQKVATELDVGYHDAFQRGWIGFTALVAGCQLWNFFAPINGITLICVVLISGVGWADYLKTRPSLGLYGRTSPRPKIGVALITILAALAVIYLTATGVATKEWSGAWDTDLYHFNTIRWMNEFAVVPGLGNLHSRLAHTSGFFVYSALFDNLWWDGQAAWFARGSLLALTLTQWVLVICNFPRTHAHWQRLYCLFTLPYLLWLAMENRPGLYFDQIAFLFQLALVLELLDFSRMIRVQRDSPGEQQALRSNWLLRLVCLAVAGYSAKPIGAVSLVGVAVIVGYCLIRGLREMPFPRAVWLRSVLGIGVLGGLVLAGHISRNFVQTGWLGYPAPIGKTVVDWAMPAKPATDNHWLQLQSVEGQYDVIKGWARMPGPEYARAVSDGFDYWFPLWKEREWRGLKPWLIYVGVVFAAWVLIVGIYRRKVAGDLGWRVGLMILAAANLMFWFTSAPDYRFGRGFFWIWVGLNGAMALAPSGKSNRWSLAVASMAGAVLFSQLGRDNFLLKPDSLIGLGRAASLPTRIMNLHPNDPIPLNVYVPVEGDRVGDSELPATPYPLAQLEWRVPGEIQSGFKWVPFSP